MLTAGCNRGILDPVGPVGHAEKTILINSTAIMLAIIIPTMLATVAFAWWFRRGNSKATYRPDWEYSGAVEMVVWAIPALTVMLLGGIAWIGAMISSRAKPLKSATPALKVDVVSLDWKWLFIYPDQGVATVNELVVPAGAPVTFRLTSATVWNSFFVPQLGTMIYTMPGMTTRLNLQADKPGDYEGLSSAFQRRRLPGHEVQGARAVRRPIRDVGPGCARHRDGARRRAYAELAKPSSYVKPVTYGAVAPGLFDAIAIGSAAARSIFRTTRPRLRIREPRRMFGKLSWSAIPFDQPIPLITSMIVISAFSAC